MTDAALIANHSDDSHSYDEPRLSPGVYPSDPQGHTLLVGENSRSLTILDLGGVIQVGGLDIREPDHLDGLAARLHQAAERMRARQCR